MQPKESADGLLCDSFQGALFLMYDRFVFQCGAVLGFQQAYMGRVCLLIQQTNGGKT